MIWHTLSSSFAFPPECSSANPSRQTAVHQRLSWACFPSAHKESAIHLPRALPAPATVRLQGLVPLLAAFARRVRAGLVSCRQRSWDSPFGVFSSRKVSGAFRPGRTHIPFLRPLYQSPRGERPARSAAVSGLRPFREFLAVAAGLARGDRRILPWVFPLQGFDGSGIGQAFTQPPLTRFATTDQP